MEDLLGQNEPFLYQMVFAVRDLMQEAYPELNSSAERIAKAVETEEDALRAYAGHRLQRSWTTIWLRCSKPKKQNLASRAMYSGAKAFKLYDTFGLPLDFMVDAARDQGIEFDQAGFDLAMEEQRERARASWKGGAGKQTASPVFATLPATVFEGYRQTESRDCEVLAIIRDGQGVRRAAAWRAGRNSSRPHSVLRRSRRTGRRQGWLYAGDHNTLVADVDRRSLSRAGSARAPGDGEAADRNWKSRWTPWSIASCAGDAAPSHRHSSAACGAAQRARHACEAGGIAGRCGAFAL